MSIGGLEDVARRRQDRRLAIALLVVVLGWLAVGAWWAWRVTAREGRPPWELYGWGRVVAVAAVPLVIAVVEVAVLLRLRSRGARWLQPSPSMALDRGERRRLVRSIREGEHLPGRDGDLARDLAERMARQRWFLAPAVVPILLALVTVAVRGFDAVGVVMTVAALVVAVSLPFAVRDVRQARRYLHDEQPPAT